MTRMTVQALMQRAIDIVGSESRLAQATGYSQHGVWRARKKGIVTQRMALAIHRATNGQVSGSDLLPDVWRHPDHVPI